MAGLCIHGGIPLQCKVCIRKENAQTSKSYGKQKCPKCKGKKWYHFQTEGWLSFAKVCEVCCRHDKGFWILPRGYRGAGKYCCNKGCGKLVDKSDIQPQIDRHVF